MGKDNIRRQLSAATKLRLSAEEQLKEKLIGTVGYTAENESQILFYELQVHQIELEMQNTELRQTRDEIEKILDKYTDLYDFAPVGYITLERDGSISAANLTAARLLGVERSQLLGCRFGQFIISNNRKSFSVFLGRIFSSREKDSCELEILKSDKQQLYVQIEAMADDAGQGCRIAVIDISARRQLEAKLELMHTELAARTAALETANIELEAFNYSVSHDLRAPLTVIHSYCQVLQEQCSSQFDENGNEYLGNIFEGTLRMNRLIDTLLNFSRILHVKMHPVTIDLSAAAHEVAAELELAEHDRQILFTIAAGITVKGDVDLWRIVITNLFGNALKYADRNQLVIIELGVTEIDGKQVYFIRDNGPGFAMADAEKLFNPFTRLPGTNVNGHGVGLATVQRIIQRHGGRIWAESEPGKGASFFFTVQ